VVSAEAQAFFERYRDAFNAGNGDAVAELWNVPASISDGRDGIARVTCWTDAAPLRANMQALCAVYRDAGPHRWTFELQEHQPLGDLHAFSRVVWTMSRPDGELLQRFATGYQLGRAAAGWRVLFCTAFAEDLNEAKRHHASQQ
jgi:hypothetical protein